MPDEIWKDVVGYEGLYLVSNYANVKSTPRNGNGYQSKILKKRITKDGYVTVCLSNKDHGKNVLLHRIVAEAFIPNDKLLPCINHKDENKLNNLPDNLEWCTYEYNINYGTCLERQKQTQICKGNYYSNICLEDLNTCLVERFKTVKDIVDKYNLDNSHICKCLKGRVKSYKNFKIYKEECDYGL